MAFHYTAKIYFDEGEIEHESGNDLDELYNWMLVKAQGQFGNINGEIIDNKTGKVVKSFPVNHPQIDLYANPSYIAHLKSN